MVSYEYEFNKEDEKLIKELSNNMRFVGLFLNVLGWLIVLGSLLRGWFDQDYIWAFDSILPGVAIILIAMWTNNAAQYFNKIIEHKGTDIENLMKAFEEIRNLYRFKFWLWVLSVIYFITIGFFL